MTSKEEGTPVIRLLRRLTAIALNPVGEGAHGKLPTDESLQLLQLRVHPVTILVALSQDGRTPSKSLLLQIAVNCVRVDVLNVVDANMLFRGPVKALLSR